MFVETIRSEGLAHLSYVVGDGDTAVVIDPRRDVEVYEAAARRHGAYIRYVVETHRNEDYLVGSRELAARTGARILRGAATRFGYGEPVEEGAELTAGDARLRVLATPGHTDESISLVLHDDAVSRDDAVAVFTGDALFVGSVGRTDLLDDREAAAAALYDSIVGKLLPLGDQAVLYPAHGAGSVCGAGMAERDVSTLGYERRHNPALQLERAAFIRQQAAQPFEFPPYFRRMEQVNRDGPPLLHHLPTPRPLSPREFLAAMADGMWAVDTREPEAVAGALLPDSLAIPLDMLPAFAGWFLPYDADIGLVTARAEDVETAVRRLVRLGYDRVVATLADGLHAWETAGLDYATIPALHARQLARRLNAGERFTLLDVRGRRELARERLPGATEIYLGHLPDRLAELPAARPVTAFCGSGRRAVIAASLLVRNGFDGVEVCLGSMAACRVVGCPILPGST